jgi:fermentation-respiration switch protein FrsA (DUF1100 family)
VYVILKSVFIIVAAAYIGWGLVLFFMQHKFVYYPIRKIEFTPSHIELEYDDISFKTADGLRLNGWFVPAKGAQVTVLFCHGNGGNISHRLESLSMFHELGVNVFIFDYRGYGMSEGKPDEKGTYLDVEAAYRWLVEEKRTGPESIVALGRSLGGSIAAYLASEREVGSLVLESAFTSFIDIGKRFYPYMPVRLFARYDYPTVDYMRKVKCPVLVIHSRTDELVPFDFGVLLHEAANEPKDFVEIQGGHNNGFLVSGREYVDAWRSWIERFGTAAEGSH